MVTKKRKAVAMIVALAMLCSMFAVTGSIATAKSKKKADKGRLIKSVTRYYYDKEGKSWKKWRTIAYKYNKKGDPTTITVSGTDGSKDVTTNIFKYKKGVKKSLKSTLVWTRIKDEKKVTEKNSWVLTAKYNKHGLRTKDTYKSQKSNSWYSYAYSYKKGYITKKAYKTADGEWDGFSDYSATIKVKNGLLTKRVVRYSMNAYNPNPLTYLYNKKGLITTIKTKKSLLYSCKYKYSKGLVTTITRTSNDGLEGTYQNKDIIKYTKKKANNARYANMINSILYNDLDNYDAQTFWY